MTHSSPGKTLARRWWVLLLTIVLAIGGTVAWSFTQRGTFETSITLTVQQVPVESAETAAESVRGLFESPTLSRTVYKTAQLTPPETLSALRRAFHTRVTGPRVLEVRFETEDPTEATILASALIQVIDGAVADWNEQSNDGIVLSVEALDPTTLAKQISYPFALPIAAGAGLLVGLLLLTVFPVRVSEQGDADFV